MKRKFFLSVAFIIVGIVAKSQNVQLHYDFGKDRKILTSTVEMFKPDDWGSTFFFVDMNYGESKGNGGGSIAQTYWEIARSFKLKKDFALEPRIEYNGGLDKNFSISNAWLVGAQYTLNNSDFTKILTLQANYKYIETPKEGSFQITAVWGLYFLDRKLAITGFMDFWKEEHIVRNDEGKERKSDFVFLTEPQIWYKVFKNLSLGSEIEISNDFAGNDGFMVNPTLAAKWEF